MSGNLNDVKVEDPYQAGRAQVRIAPGNHTMNDGAKMMTFNEESNQMQSSLSGEINVVNQKES